MNNTWSVGFPSWIANACLKIWLVIVVSGFIHLLMIIVPDFHCPFGMLFSFVWYVPIFDKVGRKTFWMSVSYNRCFFKNNLQFWKFL